MEPKKAIGRALKSTGKKQVELAKELDIPPASMNNYYNGLGEPNLKIVKLLKEKLNVSYEYLLGESDNKEINNYLIGKDLGLTDKTIERLKKYVNRSGFVESDIFYNQEGNTENYIDIINKIIENKYTEILMYWVRQYINIPIIENLEKEIKINELEKKISEQTDEEDIYILNQELDDLLNNTYEKEFFDENGYKYSELTSNKLSEARFRISEIFMRIIDDIFSEMNNLVCNKWSIVETKRGNIEVKPVCNDGSQYTIIGYLNNDER